jgi:hypothetical protein
MTSLRDKLSKKKKSMRSEEATQVIYLDTIDLEDSRSSTDETRKVSWYEKNRISGIDSDKLLTEYRMVLDILKSNILQSASTPLKNHIREALLSFYSSRSRSTSVLSRRTRKQIFQRLVNLLEGVEVIQEIFEDVGVKRVFVTDRLAARVHKTDGSINMVPLFYCEEENYIFRIMLDAEIQNSGEDGVVVFEGGSCNLLAEGFLMNSDIPGYIFKKQLKQNTSILELIRAKMFDPALSRCLSKLLREKQSGMIISGATNTGRSLMLSGLLSALPLQRIPLVIGNSVRLRTTHANAYSFRSSAVEDLIHVEPIDTLVTRISRMGITDIFIDDMTAKMLPLLMLLVERYSVYPVVTIHGSMHGAIENLFSSDDARTFLCHSLPVAVDMGSVSDECSLKAVYEVQSSEQGLDFVGIVKKELETSNWSLIEADCSSSRYFDTLKLRDQE